MSKKKKTLWKQSHEEHEQRKKENATKSKRSRQRYLQKFGSMDHKRRIKLWETAQKLELDEKFKLDVYFIIDDQKKKEEKRQEEKHLRKHSTSKSKKESPNKNTRPKRTTSKTSQQDPIEVSSDESDQSDEKSDIDKEIKTLVALGPDEFLGSASKIAVFKKYGKAHKLALTNEKFTSGKIVWKHFTGQDWLESVVSPKKHRQEKEPEEEQKPKKQKTEPPKSPTKKKRRSCCYV